MENKEIRFIDSKYRELFRIPDGGSIRIAYQDGEVKERKCTYLDDYHTQVGINVFHICEFAEKMEKIGAKYEPVRSLLKDSPDNRFQQPVFSTGRSR